VTEVVDHGNSGRAGADYIETAGEACEAAQRCRGIANRNAGRDGARDGSEGV